MANTYGTFTGSGGTTSFAIPFTNWLNDSHVIVRVAGVNYDINSSGTSYDFTVSNGNVVFNTAPDGVFFYILRDTLGIDHDDTALLYDFSDGSILTADQQDDVYRQNFYLAQEAAEAVPDYDSGWINTFDSATALAAATTLELTIPSRFSTNFPFNSLEVYGKESDVYYPIAQMPSILNDPNFTLEVDNWSDYGIYLVFDSANDKFALRTGDKAVAYATSGTGLSSKDWVTDITHLRFIIRSK